jgi:hypothetical protein
MRLPTIPSEAEPQRTWKKAVFSQLLKDGIWVAPDGVEYMGYTMRTERYRYTVSYPPKTKSNHITIGTESNFLVNKFVTKQTTNLKATGYVPGNNT